MTCHHFALRVPGTGRDIGHALICPDVSYAAIRWRDVANLDRRFADASTWHLVLSEIENKAWPGGCVEASSVLCQLVLRDGIRERVEMHYHHAPVIAASTLAITASLDGYLWSCPWR